MPMTLRQLTYVPLTYVPLKGYSCRSEHVGHIASPVALLMNRVCTALALFQVDPLTFHALFRTTTFYSIESYVPGARNAGYTFLLVKCQCKRFEIHDIPLHYGNDFNYFLILYFSLWRLNNVLEILLALKVQCLVSKSL